MRRSVLIILFAYDFLACPRIIAQPQASYIFNHIDHVNGLLNDAVYAIGQDSPGFIWISSLNTLQRYDGSRFVNYPRYHATDTINILPHTFEQYSDSRAQSWMIGGQYIYRYDSLAQKRPNHALIISADKRYELVPGIVKDTLRNQIWAATSIYGLLLFDLKTKQIYRHSDNPVHHPLLEQLPTKGLRYILMDSHQNLWIYYWSDSFYRYNLITKSISVYSLASYKKFAGNSADPSLLVNAIYEDDHANIWVGTENAGLLLYNPEKDNFKYILSKDRNSEAIQYNYDIYCVFQDREENLWIGTDKGISIFNPYRQYFTAIRSEPGNPKSLPKHEVMACIETPQGDLLIGTWGGGVSVYDHNLKFKKTIFFHGGPEANLVWSFIQEADGNIIIGCQHGYLHIYNPVSGLIRTIHPPELQNSTVRCMAKDGYGNILFGLHNGKIATWNIVEQKFYRYNDSAGSGQSPLTPVINIFTDHSQTCWVSTESGVKQFDPRKRAYTGSYQPATQNGKPVAGTFCEGIEEYNDSLLLVGTSGGSLDFFNKKTNAFTPINRAQDIQFNAVFAIKKDATGNIWFTTDYGLYKMKAGQDKITACNMENGIINSSFQSSSFYATRDGRWLTSTLTELIGFYPDSIGNEIENKAGVTITGFKVFNNPMAIDSLLYTNKPLHLSYKQNFFTVEFAALSFYNIKEIKYYYQLTSIDKDWVSAGSRRFASYTDLGAGQYVFKVTAENGNDEGQITFLNIIITPPFWKTAWFKLLLLVSVVAFIGFLFKKRIKAVRHEVELKQKIVETEMMALRAQMNPHFIFNCINSIDALIQSNDKYQATVYLNKFAKLIRNILDSSKQNTITLSKDVETLQLYIDLELFRNENKFTAQIKADNSLLQDDYKIPPLIIQPYVENAILHGLKNRPDNAGKLFVSIGRQNDKIEFVIEDNGVGRKATFNNKQAANRSYGMQMSEDRVKIFNKEDKASVFINDLKEGSQACGTKVQVFLNIQ